TRHPSLPEALADAARGAESPRETLIDGEAGVRIPAGTQPGDTVVLRGKGVPKLRSNQRGDLVLHLDVVVPSRMDAKQTEALEKFRALRTKDTVQMGSARGNGGGGIFSKLRDGFAGR